MAEAVTVTINGVDYPSWATVADGDTYMAAKIGAVGDAWRDAETDTKSMALATAYRDFALIPIKPEAFDDPAFEPVLQQASIEYAGALIEGTFFENLEKADGGTKRLKAGSAEIEYFRKYSKFSNDGASSLLPAIVYALLRDWINPAGGKGFGGAISTGTDGKSSFKHGFGVRYP